MEEQTKDSPVYAPPVDQLLSLGNPFAIKNLNYRALGFQSIHIPELLRLALDAALLVEASDVNASFAPIHAWFVLIELEAFEAIPPLLALIDEMPESSVVQVLLPRILPLFERPMVSAVEAYLNDPQRSVAARIAAAGILTSLEEELRPASIGALCRVLERSSADETQFNGALLSALVQLNAVEAVPVIERAYAEAKIDEEKTASLDEVLIYFGLKAAPPRPKADGFGAGNRTERAQQSDNRRHIAKESRRRNRKNKK